MPEISIITPCYNQGKYISECLDSVLAQSFNDFEVVVVNDGSTDNSVDILNEYAKKDSRIKIINQENQGVVVARNNAIAHAQGRFIYPLDGDDKIAPNCLAVLYDVITTTQNRVVFSEVEMFGKKQEIFNQPALTKIEMYGFRECYVISALFYKSDFEKFGGYREEFNGFGGDDVDYWMNYMDNNMPMHRVSQVLFFYRTKENAESLWKNYDEKEFLQRQKMKNKNLVKYHPKIKIYSILYNVRNFIYQNRINASRTQKIKILRIPVYVRKVK